MALGGAKERHRELEERCAAAASAQRSAEAAAAAAERRAADAVCLRREGSSAAVHAQIQLQSLHRSLQVLLAAPLSTQRILDFYCLL